MSTLTIDLPDLKDEERADLRRLIAAKLYERGALSLGQAAKLAGMDKWDFPKVLGDYGVNYFNLTPEELAEDVKNA
jgi:predicted HTH domain antitoxin